MWSVGGVPPAGNMFVAPPGSLWLDFAPSRISERADLHGVVIVGDDTWWLSSGGLPEAGVVGVAEDALQPRQDPRWGHGLVREMTWRHTHKHAHSWSICFQWNEGTRGRRAFSYTHAVGTGGWRSSATPGHWTAAPARWSQPENGPAPRHIIQAVPGKSNGTEKEFYVPIEEHPHITSMSNVCP